MSNIDDSISVIYIKYTHSNETFIFKINLFIQLGKSMTYDLRENSNQDCFYHRKNRYFCKQGDWYFKTREQTIQGPFGSKDDAKKGFKQYVNKMLDESYALLEAML